MNNDTLMIHKCVLLIKHFMHYLFENFVNIIENIIFKRPDREKKVFIAETLTKTLAKLRLKLRVIYFLTPCLTGRSFYDRT